MNIGLPTSACRRAMSVGKPITGRGRTRVREQFPGSAPPAADGMIRTMTTEAFTLFDTAIGPCGVAWGRRGLTGLQLPEADVAETRARMARRFPDAREIVPPPGVRRALDRIVSLLRGEP